MTKPAAPEQAASTTVVVGLVGPRSAPTSVTRALADARATAVDIVAGICRWQETGRNADACGPLPAVGESLIRATVAALACDALVAVLPCSVGLDPATAAVWEAAAEAGLPRAVVITGLADDAPDFEDLAAIAERALGPDCVPARLPVWDDADQPAASLSLADLTIATPDPIPADPEHAAAAAGARDALVAALSVLAGDAFAAAVAAGLTPGGIAAELATALCCGELAPVWPDTADAAWADDAMAALAPAAAAGALSAPSDRLVRRDASGQPGTGSAAAVLGNPDPQTCLLRSVFGNLPTEGAVVVTCCGPDAEGHAQPYRSWPTAIELLHTDGELHTVRSVMAARLGEVLADSQTWLVPVVE